MAEEQISDKQYTTVVLQLLVDSRRQSVQGQAVAVGSHGVVRFRGWRGLARAVRGLIALPPPNARYGRYLPTGGAGSKPQSDLSTTSAADQSDLTGG